MGLWALTPLPFAVKTTQAPMVPKRRTSKVVARMPAGIVTELGTIARFGWLLVSVTGMPVAGAGGSRS